MKMNNQFLVTKNQEEEHLQEEDKDEKEFF